MLPKIYTASPCDICGMRAIGKGLKGGRESKVTIDLIDRYDEATGFTGMERLTGWHCAIMMGFQARGRVAPGVVPVESAVPAGEFMEALGQRGIHFEVNWD
jgi:lysine 6-dehydrogenase